MFRIIFTSFIIILLYCGISFAQQTALRPILVAIQTPDLEKSINWYQQNLGFEIKSKKDFPDYGLKIAILEQHGFELELVENRKAINPKALTTNQETPLEGFAKLTFEVENLDLLFDKLSKNQVKVIMSIRASNREDQKGARFFMVHDIDGNLLQFISK